MAKQAVKPHRYLFLLRISLGLIFTIAGLNGLIHFVNMPAFSPEGEAFIESLRRTGIFWNLIKLVELSAGVLLLFGALGQLAVLTLVPITMGILLFHVFLSPQGALLGYVAFALEALIIWFNRHSLKLLFRTPSGDHGPSN